jgi:hypothetical protein
VGNVVNVGTVKDILEINMREVESKMRENNEYMSEIIWHTTLRRMCKEIS